MAINFIEKENLKDKLYLVQQAKGWIVWHGTLDALRDSLFWDVEGIEIIEYSKGVSVQHSND